MDLESKINIFLLIGIAVIYVIAVWHSLYDDTVIQCISFGGMCIGALAVAGWIYERGNTPGPISVFIWSISLFTVETMRKIAVKVKMGNFRIEEPYYTRH